MLSKIKGKTLAYISLVVYIISCLPVIYVGFFNYATGDDLLYGATVKNAIANHIGFREMMKQVWDSIVTEYNGFQGTWASMIIWRFEPSIWGEELYYITIFIALFMLNFGVFYFYNEVLVKMLKMDIHSLIIAGCWSLFYIIQFMIYPRGGLYWYTGMMQYTFAFGVCLIVFVFAIKYLNGSKKTHFVSMVLLMFYLGGSGYPEIVMSVVGFAYIIGWGLLSKDSAKIKRAKLLIIPFIFDLISFAINAMAPGNAARGGEDYGFSAYRVYEVFYKCFKEGTLDLFRYFINVRSLVLLPICIFAIAYASNTTLKLKVRHLVITGILGWFLVCMTRSAEYYAGDTVAAGISGGVYDSYYYISILYIVIMCAMIGLFASAHKKSEALSQKAVGIATIVTLLFCLLLNRHLIGNMLDYTIYDYVSTGQARDYKAQMNQRFELLSYPNELDVVLPYINEYQGPLMHMPVNENVDGYTNSVTAKFYGKRTVTGIPRPEWEELYGDK